jgi:hypothetical protein
MDSTLIVALVSAFASFVGSWSAFRVHFYYMRRDLNNALGRISTLERRMNPR